MEKKPRSSKNKDSFQFDPLDVTESLGYKTYRKNGRNSWSREDDDELRSLLNLALIDLGYSYGIDDVKSIQQSEVACKRVSWDKIASQFKNSHRKPKELRKRWTSSLDPNLKRGKWDSEEDGLLLKAYAKHGPHWLNVAGEIEGRTEDQCAKRYIEILGPSSEGRLRKWTLEEDLSLVSKVKTYGTKWRRISSELESRPSLTCRNRWRKIITSVVRRQAPPEIVKAVNENQDIDALVNSLRLKIKEKKKLHPTRLNSEELEVGEQEVEEDENNIASTKLDYKTCDAGSDEMPNALRPSSVQPDQKPRDERDIMLKAESKRELKDPCSSGMNNRGSSEPKSLIGEYADTSAKDSQNLLLHQREDGLKGNSPQVENNAHEPIVSTEVEKLTLVPIKDLSPLPERNPLINKAFSSGGRSPVPNTMNTSPLLSNVYPKESSVRSQPSTSLDQRVLDTSFDHLAGTSGDLGRASSHHAGQMEWKFTLKDGQGLSISSGSISSSSLVKELIEQAKKYSLKISIHQHIHHHYGGQAEKNSINGQEPMTTFQPNTLSASSVGQQPLSDFQSNTLSSSSAALGHTGINNDFFSNPDYKASFGSVGHNAEQDNDFFSHEPTYNVFGLEPSLPADSSQINGSSAFYPANNPVTHQSHSPIGYPTRPGTTSSTGSHSTGNEELADIGRNRVSHFNYLSSTVRPQLESSDSTKAAGLNKLLNPSPTSSGKKKEKRRKSLQSEASASNSSCHDSMKPSPTGLVKKDSKPLDASTVTYLYEEEGPDFWESLRSLAGKPQSDDGNSYTHHPYEEEDYDMLYNLFDDRAGGVQVEKVHEKPKRSTGGDKDPILPFNPS